MPEWWTYGLSDFLLFSPRTYYRLFELHNADLWPAQLVTLALGLGMLALLGDARPRAGRVAAAILAGCWLWVGWTFLHGRYATINWAADHAAAAFAAQAALLLLLGVAGGRLGLVRGWVGLGLVAVALMLYPLIGPLLGRGWAQAEVFGIAPDPTAVATLGVLALSTHRVRWILLAVPVAWCLVSAATLWTMGSPEAPIPALAAAVALAASTRRRPRSGHAAEP